jgi:hypothetical protein
MPPRISRYTPILTAFAAWLCGVNHYDDVIASLETERSKESAPKPINSLLDQWMQERSAELAVYVDRLADAFGAPRNDARRDSGGS